jgi:transposase InsO family protein
VSSGAYYKRVKAGESGEGRGKDEELIRLIREIMGKHHGRYGSLWVREGLRKDYGKQVSRKKAAGLMRGKGIPGRRMGKFIPATNSNHGLRVGENLLKGSFRGERAGRSGLATFRVPWEDLTVIPDLYDRKVIGWALSAGMEACHTSISALKTAFNNRRAPEGLLFHSDGGIPYCAKSFRDSLYEYSPSVRRSMRWEGEVSGQRLCREFFQNAQERDGNAGRQTYSGGG